MTEPRTDLLAGPTGLGTSAARFSDRLTTGAEPALPAPPGDPAYVYRQWGDGSAPPLYCPVTGRVDDALAAEADRRLALWAAGCGFDEEECEQLGHAGFGRLVMRAHPDCDDPDRLLISARLNAAWWAADDLYADDTALGAVPQELPPKLA